MITRDGRVPPLPAGTETMLIRTMGLFLEDGTFVDSGLPVEVILRLFRFERNHVDMASSDYGGTYVYQYKLSRRKLLEDPRTLGWKRIDDDETQFFGFFSEVPDLSRANSLSLTTMRNNCIACHSELYYGTSTIFSLARVPPETYEGRMLKDGMLERTDVPGRFIVRTELMDTMNQVLLDFHQAESP